MLVVLMALGLMAYALVGALAQEFTLALDVVWGFAKVIFGSAQIATGVVLL